VITRTGRYRWFPIAGTAIGVSGCCSWRGSTARRSTALAAVYMLILGMGLGMVMQVLVLAVQNSVDYEQLGVATSGATLFRSIGGSLGTAILGAVFTNRLPTRCGQPAGGARPTSAASTRPRSSGCPRACATATSRRSPTRSTSSSSSRPGS
jgi:hypothetical protein